MAAVSAGGSTVCVLDPSFELLMQRSIAFVVSPRSSTGSAVRRVKMKQALAAFLQAVGDGR